jgi:hypothetical protein
MFTIMGSRITTLCMYGGLISFFPLRASADADALIDALGPREVAVGEALRGGAVGASAATLNPAGLPLTHELVFEGGYGYRPSDRASLVSASACDSTNAAPGCFYYNYVGAAPELDGMEQERRIHTAGLTVSRALSPHVMFGSGIKYFNVKSTVMGEGDSSGFNWDAGLTLRVNDLVNLGVVGYNLWGDEAAQFPRAVGGGFTLRPVPSLRASFDILFKTDVPSDAKSGRFGGGLEYFFQPGSRETAFPIRLGGLHERADGRTFVSGGLGIATTKLGIDIAARRAVRGDEEILLIASLRFFGPRDAGGSANFGTE